MTSWVTINFQFSKNLVCIEDINGGFTKIHNQQKYIEWSYSPKLQQSL